MKARRRLALALACAAGLWCATASAQDVRAGVEQLASQIMKGAPEGKQLRIAVADFPDLQGATSDLGRYIASRLTTRLAQTPRFSVIERQRLGQVLAELKFSMSDLVDPAKAKQLGRMAGVEAIVVGTVSDLGNQVDLDARLIEIETNRMLLGATTTISRDQVVDDMLKRGRQEATSSAASQPSVPSGSAPPNSPGFTQGGFRFDSPRCARRGDQLQCAVTFTNLGSEARELQFYGGGGGLVDDSGNHYRTSLHIGPMDVGSTAAYTFLPQLPIRVLFVARQIDPKARKINIVIAPDRFGSTPILREVLVEQ